MGFFGMLFGTRKWNDDPDQQIFAKLLIEAAESGNTSELLNWIVKRPWKASETRNRITHALSMVYVSATPEIYERAKVIGHRFYEASYKL